MTYFTDEEKMNNVSVSHVSEEVVVLIFKGLNFLVSLYHSVIAN